ncbi:hypothetical protein BPTFM16_02543 [Altererythrobacter insulae]|nr:hypothetical protein BPTFM16_02543 [Altererythrobacter insulae]
MSEHENNLGRSFCALVKRRSEENEIAIAAIVSRGVFSPAVAVLRQEIDSMIRAIFLLSKEIPEREVLIQSVLAGGRWRWPGKKARITDKEMVDFALKYEGWTKVAYEFGCAFVHLSQFHNYESQNPLAGLRDEDREIILHYPRQYHGAPDTNEPTALELLSLIPSVFEKVKSNVQLYLEEIEAGRDPALALGL